MAPVFVLWSSLSCVLKPSKVPVPNTHPHIQDISEGKHKEWWGKKNLTVFWVFCCCFFGFVFFLKYKFAGDAFFPCRYKEGTSLFPSQHPFSPICRSAFFQQLNFCLLQRQRGGEKSIIAKEPPVDQPQADRAGGCWGSNFHWQK